MGGRSAGIASLFTSNMITREQESLSSLTSAITNSLLLGGNCRWSNDSGFQFQFRSRDLRFKAGCRRGNLCLLGFLLPGASLEIFQPCPGSELGGGARA